MMESSRGGGRVRLCHLSFNHIDYCTLPELRGVLEHPVHPLDTPLHTNKNSRDKKWSTSGPVLQTTEKKMSAL